MDTVDLKPVIKDEPTLEVPNYGTYGLISCSLLL